MQITIASSIRSARTNGKSVDVQMENVTTTCPECVTCYLKCKCILPGTDIIKNFSDYIQPRPDHCPKCVCNETDDCSDSPNYKLCPTL